MSRDRNDDGVLGAAIIWIICVVVSIAASLALFGVIIWAIVELVSWVVTK